MKIWIILCVIVLILIVIFITNYNTTENLILDVSTGEALDKLSILEIKIDKIKDNDKLNDCKKEYDTLTKSLKKYKEELPYHYKILKETNETLWDLEDKFHTVKDKDEMNEVFSNIKKENDRRFRIKKKINILSESNLKEQKSYAKKKALVYGHLGLGDMFWMTGAVRYFSTTYDEVLVVCKEKYQKVVKNIYKDDPSIKLMPIENDIFNFRNSSKGIDLHKEGYDIYVCGHIDNKPVDELPSSFYDHVDLPREYRTKYFYIPDSKESIQLLKNVQKINTRYILIHQQCSIKTIDIFSKLSNKSIPVLDINENHYPKNDKFYNIAQLVVNVDMTYYKNLIENAEEIYCIESSFYCLCTHLDLSNVKKKVAYNTCESNRVCGIFEAGGDL